MIKYRIVKELDDKTVYYTGRKNRWFDAKTDGIFSYKGGWSESEEAAKYYRFERDTVSMARHYKAMVETVSFEPTVLDITDYSE